MKRLILIAVTSLTLAGCITPGNDILKPPEPTTESVDIDSVFADVVRKEIDGVSSNDKDVADAGRAVCLYLDNDPSVYRALTFVSTETGATMEDSAFFVGASVGAFCPEYESLIREGV